MNIVVVCINSDKIPDEIPEKYRPHLGREYHIEDAEVVHNGEESFIVVMIKELDLVSLNIKHKSGAVYTGFDIRRFAFKSDKDLEKIGDFLSAQKQVKKLGLIVDKDVDQLQKELEIAVLIEDYEEAAKLRDIINLKKDTDEKDVK